MRLYLFLLAICLPATAAFAQEGNPLPALQPYNDHGFYTATWNGVQVGTLVFNARETDEDYGMEMNVKSEGVTWAFTKHQSATHTSGIKRADRYIPQRFETVFSLRKKTRHIVLDYDAQGNITHEINNPPEPADKRPPVPDELKTGIADPLSMFFMHRARIYTALQNNEPRFTIRMYDGRRLTDLHYVVESRELLKQNNQKVPVIVFRLSRTAVAGFKDKELKEMAKKEDPQVRFYLSDDGRLIPLRITVKATMGTFYINYTQQCADAQQCNALLK